MTEVEANNIAETIRSAALQKIRVETIEKNPKGHTFRVRCRYVGPTFKYGQQLLLHGMPLYITKSYDWALLYRLLNKS
jgi:hypothetical protein